MHAFDFDVIWRTLPYLMATGMVFTLKLTILSTIGAIILGTLLAMMRLSSNRLVSGFAGFYANLLRALPLILIIFWFYFLVPYIVGWLTHAGHPVAVGGFTSALITFIIFEAAYFCEIMRAGIQSIPVGQAAAGYALGLSYWQVMANIVLPQAFRNMTPVLLTQMIVLFQDTSLVYVLSLTDFLGAANVIAQRDGRMVEMYLFAAVVYFLISYAASRAVRRLNRRLAVAAR
ncbi:MAG TPA: ABC transporter permease subunit [Castellaniella sp.]|uniref:amino acid ABC transporter permease n=1 Tax=Castellaniella sp. TaxID=1955812 RepID=UPI002EE5260B